MTTLAAEPYAVTFQARLGDAAEVAALLTLEGAVRQGHFRLLSGLHADQFLAFSAIADDSRNLQRVAAWLGPTVDAWRVDAVVAPSTAGVGLAGVLARRISAPLHLAAVGADGRPTNLVGSELSRGARVLIVNDVTTTGAAIHTLADLVHAGGSSIAGAAWFASRRLNPRADFDFPTAHIVDVDLSDQSPDRCSACRAGDASDIQYAIDLN